MINFTNPTPFTDPQNQALTLTAMGVPAWLTFADNGNGTYTVTGTAPATGGPWTVNVTATDTDNNTSTDHVLTIDCGGLSMPIEGACEQTDNTLPEPSVWCGTGVLNGVTIGGGTVSEPICGINLTQILIRSNPFSASTQPMIISFDAPIPASMTDITISSGTNAQTIDLTPFVGSSSVSINNLSPLIAIDILGGLFTISSSC